MIVDGLGPEESFKCRNLREEEKIPDRRILTEIQDLSFLKRVEIFELGQSSFHVINEILVVLHNSWRLEED